MGSGLEAQDFDVIVIGAGPGGEVAAARLADHGKRVALVERHLVGGECSFYACMPSKALLRPAEALQEAGRIPGAAEAIGSGLDVRAVLERRDEVIHSLSDDSQMPWLEDRRIPLFRGQAVLEGERRVRVGAQQLNAVDAVIIAVGTGALFPPISGLAQAGAWSNRQITTAESVPQSLIVLGGGVVGVEMAQAWASLGSQVTVVEALGRLIAGYEPVASEELCQSLERDGVRVLLGAKASEVKHGHGQVTLVLDSGAEVSGDHLLVAVGRQPQTEGLGLESVGLCVGGYIEVDDQLRVPGQPWLYAIGDVNGRSLLTHSAKYQARIAADNILGLPARAYGDVCGQPQVVFTRPQVAAVGLTLAAARAAGHVAEAMDLKTSLTAGSSFYGRGTPGTTRFVVDTERHVLLGVTFVGAQIADFLQAATIAVMGEVPLAKLAHAVAPFPTRSELWLKFIEFYEQRRGISLHSSNAPAATAERQPA